MEMLIRRFWWADENGSGMSFGNDQRKPNSLARG
jgi:hypothetical protein